MAQAKRKERVSSVTPEEASIINRLAALAKIEKKTDGQKDEAKALRAKLAPIRFVRLARQRVPRALKAVEAIGNLTGSGYMHTEEQAQKILGALDAVVERVRSKLTEGGEVEQGGFTL